VRILALDASTTAVGWCAAEDGEYVVSGVFRPAGVDAQARLQAIHEWLYRRMSAIGPTVLAYEEPHGDKGNRRTDRWLGAVMGVALSVACEFRCQFVRVHNSTVKATGYHKGAIRDAALLVGKEPREMGGDEADAIGVWQAVERMKREEELG